ncbi:TetR-like C-terminal domain-containing protein [Ureibacillus sp. MALMAid1270]|uniref:TetR-like C-terminal domain-containing protein n=1 Tax=Ureibacillus sp. MALMAid1270 TaxID=3411629 RepID=UPI003BA50F90
MALGNQGDPSFSEKMKEILKDTLIVRLSEYSPMLAQEEFKRYFSEFFTSAILGLFQEWLEDYKGKTIDDFAKIHFQILSFIGNLSLIVASKQPFDSK